MMITASIAGDDATASTAVASSANTSEPDGTSDLDRASALSTSDSQVPAPDREGPLEQVVKARTRMSVDEIRQQLDELIDEQMIACASERGVIVGEDQLPPNPSEIFRSSALNRA